MAAASSPSHRAKPGLARLWQLPLFVLSLGLFGYAAYLFIDPKPGRTIDQQIELARAHLRYDRPEAAADQLNKLLGGERLTLEDEAKVHLLLAQSIEGAQRLTKLDLPANHERIIEQSKIAISQGVRPDADIYRRLGESYEALGQPDEALKNYCRAEAMDVNRSLRLKRKVIELQIAKGDAGAAEASLDDYLRPDSKLSDSERAWALGGKSHLLADAGDFIAARGLLGEALRLNPDPMTRGQLHYWLGYSQWKLGDAAEAERLLRVARDLMTVRHPADADAAHALGRIHQERRAFGEAAAFYESVLVRHPDAAAAVPSKLGRGVCRIALGEDDAGLNDLGTLVNVIADRPAHKTKVPDVVAGLREAAATLAGRDNFQGALEVMAYEQALTPTPAAEFSARLAAAYDKRSDQVQATVAAAADEAEAFRRAQQARDLRTKAGDAHIAYAKRLAGGGNDDDKAYGEAVWKAVDLYDRAGSPPLAVAALERFVSERPDDALAPDALLRLGRAYRAGGDFERAITALRRNQYRYPNSLAASKSGVPLAQAYIAKGPESHEKAELVLKAAVEDNRLITPDAAEFRQALFELAHLYYRTERYEEAVARLEELTERYPDEERFAQVTFLMGDSYRRSAVKLRQELAAKDRAKAADARAAKDAQLAAAGGGGGVTVATTAGAAKQAATTAAAGGEGHGVSVAGRGAEDNRAAAAQRREAEAAIRERLTRAGERYAAVIKHFGRAAPVAEMDQLYCKLSHFYRADCLYDVGDYRSAITLYDTAAGRYQNDPSALAAYVQIVNAYCALGKLAEARTANERAKGLLRKMPAGAFDAASAGGGGPPMSKQYWEQWLRWTNDTGMFGKDKPPPGEAIFSSGQETGGQ